MLLIRLLSVLSPVLLALLATDLFFKPERFYYILVLSLAVVFLSLFCAVKLSKQVKHLSQVFFYIAPGLLINLGALLVLLLLENIWFRAGLVFLMLLSLLYYFNGLFNRFYKSAFLEKDRPKLNFRLLEVLIIFFVSAGLFGLIEFLNLPKLLLMAVVFLLVWLLSRINEFFNQPDEQPKAISGHLLIGLMAAEIFWAIISFSFVYYLKGLLLAFIYLVFSLFRDSDSQKLERPVIRNYLIATVIILVLIFLTARWF